MSDNISIPQQKKCFRPHVDGLLESAKERSQQLGAFQIMLKGDPSIIRMYSKMVKISEEKLRENYEAVLATLWGQQQHLLRLKIRAKGDELARLERKLEHLEGQYAFQMLKQAIQEYILHSGKTFSDAQEQINREGISALEVA